MKELNHYGYNSNEYQQSQGPLKNTECVDTQASQKVPAYKMMRAEDVRNWVDDQWEHYTEEGAEQMTKEDIRELVNQAFVEFQIGEVPQNKFESLLEMRTDANSEEVDRDEIKEIIEELVLQHD